MRARRFRLLFVVTIAVLVVSLGGTMTAAMNVPPSNAGITSVTMPVQCSFTAEVTFDPTNLNRVGQGHLILTVTIAFPDGVPSEAAGASITGVTLSLPGDTQTISPLPGGGPSDFEFTRDSVVNLVGPVNGDITLVAGGTLGLCTFTGEGTIKVTGPIR